MSGKRGFTFVEVLVIVVLIAIMSLVAVPSYKKGVETSKNNQAKAKLVEIANAVRMYNEDARGASKIAGTFGTGGAAAGYSEPDLLFFTTTDDDIKDTAGKYAYLKDSDSFSGTGFRGYNYYICTPNSPDAKCDGDINIIAIMTASSSITDERYVGKKWKVSNNNPGKVIMSTEASS